MTKSSFKEFALVSTLAILILGATTAFAGTWAPPTATPTGGEPDAPIIVNGDQTKAGALIVNATKGDGTYAATGLDVPNGNVGIGTASPIAKLQIHGNYNNDGSGGILLDANDDNLDTDKYSLRINPYVVGSGMVGYQFQTKSYTGGANVPLSFDNAGNTTVANLCLGGVCNSSWPSSGTASQWTNSGSSIYYNGGNVGIGIAAPTRNLSINGQNAYLSFNYSGAEKWVMGEENSVNGRFVLFDNAISNYPLAVLPSNGYVGILTTNPARPLEVNNAMKFTNSSSDGNDGVIGTAPFLAGLNIVGINTDGGGRKINVWGTITQNQGDVCISGGKCLSSTLSAVNTSVQWCPLPTAGGLTCNDCATNYGWGSPGKWIQVGMGKGIVGSASTIDFACAVIQ